jgi:sugar/nucleoside kinase (ribokinase family)
VSILAVGTVALDSIETPFGSASRVLGGSATYLTLAARYFCDDVRLVGVIGSDFPEEYLAMLRDSGVNLEGLEVNPDELCFAWAGRYHYDLNERDTLATDLNVLEKFNPTLPASFRSSEIVCLGNLDPAIQQRVVQQVNGSPFVVCDTMNFWIENTPDALRETLRLVDCLIINDSEARELSGEPNLVRAARIIRAMGPRILVIKKGEHGALLFDGDIVFSAPAYPLEDIQDPTGAGDTFAGGFVGYLSRAGNVTHDSLKRAVIFGSAMASFAVERFGPERLLDLNDGLIHERLDGFRVLAEMPDMFTLRASV